MTVAEIAAANAKFREGVARIMAKGVAASEPAEKRRVGTVFMELSPDEPWGRYLRELEIALYADGTWGFTGPWEIAASPLP